MTSNETWERDAENWIAWARTPGHDVYWSYRESFLELVPQPGGAALEVGCGEGRVCRDLTARGHRVIGVDTAPTLLAAAREAHPDGEYLLADAADLPFADATFDLVIAYNSLMDVQDLQGAVREAGRVLEPRGRLCVCVVHPLADAGEWTSREDEASFVISKSYFEPRPWGGTFERAGLSITLESRRYPLRDYAQALERAGLLIEAIREPSNPNSPRWSRLPGFLFLRALKP